MTWDFSDGNLVLQAAGFALTLIGGVVAILTYRRDVRHRQTDWLYQLFEKFYEKETYRRIRQAIDYQVEPDYSELQRQIAGQGGRDLEEQFSDYLNFFEFICNLERTGRMARRDLDNMFDYYLSTLAKRDFVVDYAKRNGFEGLYAEFKRRGRG